MPATILMARNCCYWSERADPHAAAVLQGHRRAHTAARPVFGAEAARLHQARSRLHDRLGNDAFEAAVRKGCGLYDGPRPGVRREALGGELNPCREASTVTRPARTQPARRVVPREPGYVYELNSKVLDSTTQLPL
jgi:hypothetical protein